MRPITDRAVSEPLYTRDILRLAASIPGIVPFAELPNAVDVRSPTCGSRVAMVVETDADGRVTALRQAVEACAFGQAAAALVGQYAEGNSLAEARSAVDAVRAWLGGADGEPWPGMAVLDPARSRSGRHGAILLPFRALVAALEAQ
ncbi:hypothetical protein [Sphingomonas jaspsi]|uniref:hypothetical protein n=1 Tax=Sphingomonas jaspsi TaxID=392409 RepID=UPI0004B9EA83|nr:hypothetical protein [Sphingomonas jaspsi]